MACAIYANMLGLIKMEVMGAAVEGRLAALPTRSIVLELNAAKSSRVSLRTVRDNRLANRVCNYRFGLACFAMQLTFFALGSLPHLTMVHGGEGHDHLFTRRISCWCFAGVGSWAAWVLSVLFVSWLILYRQTRPLAMCSSSPIPESKPLGTSLATPLLGKRSSCASGGVSENAYNTPLHVGALFIILFVSTLACAFPILATKFPGLRIPGRFFFAIRHFGTGVLIATAFVHLLPTAFISLGNPCLDSFWVEDYPAMPGAIALAAIFFVIVIEMVFHPSRHIRPVQIVSSEEPNQIPQRGATEEAGSAHGCIGSANTLPLRDMGPLRGKASSIGQGLSRLDIEQREMSQRDSATLQQQHQKSEDIADEPVPMERLSPEQKQRKELLQCILLELGILFHSVFIGMALSVSTGSEFVVLLIAIVFHRKLMAPHII